MRNLRTVSHQVGKVAADITAVCWDASKDEVLITCGPSSPNHKIELLRLGQDLTRHDYDPAFPLYVAVSLGCHVGTTCVLKLLLTLA